MAKKINQNQLYENYVNDQSSGLSGIRSTIDGSPIETVGTIPELSKINKQTNEENYNAPGIQSISSVYGSTDYGNSIYDAKIQDAFQLNDLEDTRAKIQPAIDKWGAGIGTFVGKTLTNTAGALGTLFYGVPDAIFSGEFNKIYNNDFNKLLGKVDNSIDDTFKVYMSDAERNGNLFQQTIGSNAFWAKSLLGDGMSFAASAILSAYALGGVGSLLGKAGSAIEGGAEMIGATAKEGSILSKAANALKYNSDLWNGSENAANVINKASKFDKFIAGTKNLTSTTSKLFVGGGYFGSIEANSFLQRAQQKHTQEYYDLHGEPKNQEDLDTFNADQEKFNQDILPTANALFCGVAALAGTAELAVFPRVFGPEVSNIIKAAQKESVLKPIEGAIEKSSLEEVEKTGLQKGLHTVGNIIEPSAQMGLKLMGGQTFLRTLADDYVDKRYNPDSAKRTYDVINSLGNAFEQAYATKDGWKSIMSGIVMGALGAPNMFKIGHLEIDPTTGKKSLKPFTLDPEKAWWTGGVYGKFQQDFVVKQQAEKIRENYNAQDPALVLEHISDNIKNKEGLASDLYHMNIISSLSNEMDQAVQDGDFLTAKTASNDIKHNYYKSRIDSGNKDSIEKELFEPIEKMSSSDFGEQFGYGDNRSDADLSKRKTEVLKRERDNVDKLSKNIDKIDTIFRFDLSKEDGRRNRDMLIYAVHTIDDVDSRIGKLKDTIKNNTKGNLKEYIHDDSKFNDRIKEHENLIEDANKSIKDNSDESNVKLQNEKIDHSKRMIDEYEAQRKFSKQIESESKSWNETGVELPANTAFATDVISEKVGDLYKNENPLDGDQKLKETQNAIRDLKGLMIRKEEALEMYSTAKNPKNYNNFITTHRVVHRWLKAQRDVADKIVEDQNNEIKQAEENITKNGDDINTASSKSGATKESVQQLIDAKERMVAMKISGDEDTYLKDFNEKSGLDFQSINDIENLAKEIREEHNNGDSNVSDDDLKLAFEIDKQLTAIHENAKELILNPDKPTIIPTITQPETNDINDTNVDIISESTVDKVNQGVLDAEIDMQDKTPTNIESNYVGDKLFNAFNKVAYLARNYVLKVVNGKINHIDKDLNDVASKSILNYNPKTGGINVDTKLTLEIEDDNYLGMDKKGLINATINGVSKKVLWSEHKKSIKEGKNSKEYNDKVPIAIKKDGITIGYLHDIDYMNSDKLVEDATNITLNRQKISKIRQYVVDNGKTETKITYRGNGKIARTEGNVRVKTTEAFPDKDLQLTMSKSGDVLNRNGKSLLNGKVVMNGIVALVPVNLKDGEVQHLVCPIVSNKLSEEQSFTIYKAIELFVKNLTKESEYNAEEHNRLVKKISDNVKLKETTGNLNFNIKTLDGLRNFIGLYTYSTRGFDHGKLKPTSDNANLRMFGFDENESNGEKYYILSFGTPGNILSYKLSRPISSDNNTTFNVGIRETGEQGYRFKNADGTPIKSFSEFDYTNKTENDNPLLNHLKQSFFYSNSKLSNMKDDVTMPLISRNNDNILDVSFDKKSYSDVLKENSSTNLTSFNIGDKDNPKWIYSVQANTEFDTSQMIKDKEISNPVIKVGNAPSLEAIKLLNSLGYSNKQIKDLNKSERDNIVTNKITQEDYVKKQSLDIVNEKYQRLKTNVKLEFPEVKEEDLNPFEVEESVENDLIQKPIPTENLGKSFIDFANEQSKDVRQSLKRALKNKDIETKCE